MGVAHGGEGGAPAGPTELLQEGAPLPFPLIGLHPRPPSLGPGTYPPHLTPHTPQARELVRAGALRSAPPDDLTDDLAACLQRWTAAAGSGAMSAVAAAAAAAGRGTQAAAAAHSLQQQQQQQRGGAGAPPRIADVCRVGDASGAVRAGPIGFAVTFQVRANGVLPNAYLTLVLACVCLWLACRCVRRWWWRCCCRGWWRRRTCTGRDARAAAGGRSGGSAPCRCVCVCVRGVDGVGWGGGSGKPFMESGVLEWRGGGGVQTGEGCTHRGRRGTHECTHMGYVVLCSASWVTTMGATL